MEMMITLLMAAALMRAALLPLRWSLGLAVHSGLGFASLWLLNLASGVTGITIPVNAVSVLTAGTLGLPGIGILTALTLL